MSPVVPGPGAAGQPSSALLVLDAIRVAGTISRVELTAVTGLTSATVSTAVRRLVDDGLVVTSGLGESTGGKRRVLLRLDPAARYAVGVNLDHEGLRFAVTDLAGNVVAEGALPGTAADEPADVLEALASKISGMLRTAGVDHRKVLGIGFVSPGAIHLPAGMSFLPPFLQPWANRPVRETLQTLTGLPVLLENDATAAAVGEYWSGGAGRTTAFGALFLGAGIGSGVIVNGAVYRGASSNSGEIGHVCVDAAGPACWCGSRGCVETLASPGAVVRRAAERGLRLDGDLEIEQFAALARAARAGHDTARELLEESAELVAIAAQTLANVMDLGHIVLTGPVVALAAEAYESAVVARLKGAFFARLNHRIQVEVSARAADAATIGGAAAVLYAALAPRTAVLDRAPG